MTTSHTRCALALIGLLFFQSVQAKCGFLVPCRGVKVEVLSCVIDPDSLAKNQRSIEQLQGYLAELKAKGGRDPNFYEQTIRSLQTHPYSYEIVARVKAVKAEYCEGQQHESHSFVRSTREIYQILRIAQRSMIDSIGSDRRFYYAGETAEECPKLLKATELSITMSESWCESAVVRRPWQSSTIPIGFITSFERK